MNDEELVEVIEKAGDRERLFAFSDEQITALKAIGLAMVPVKEEYIVRGVLDDLRSAGFQVFRPEDCQKFTGWIDVGAEEATYFLVPADSEGSG